MNYHENFTLSFIISPYRYKEFTDAWKSLVDIKIKSNVILVFNPYSDTFSEKFNDHSVMSSQILKFDCFHSIAQCWNLSLILSPTRYVILLNDDIIFREKNLLDKLYEKHKAGHQVVHASENWSATSIDKSIVAKVGWFDERFPHSAEDTDFRFRMERLKITDFRFKSHLIQHLNSSSGRAYLEGCGNSNMWDISSKHLYEKWGIQKYMKDKTGQDFDFSNPLVRRQFQSTGFFRMVDSSSLIEVLQTPDYYPEYKKKFAELL